MDTPNEGTLNQLPYSELKKCAKKYGIKGNSKKSLIASILEKTHQDEDSFVTMEQKIINSCKKHKETKFDTDKKIISDTPRRETYTIDTPTVDNLVFNKDLELLSASPVLRSTPTEKETMNITLSRGSERKQKKRKVSFVTPIRKSLRLSCLTPQYASIKNRPKTPIPSRKSSGVKNASITMELNTPIEVKGRSRMSKVSGGGKEKRPSTPMPQSKNKRMKLSSTGSVEEYIGTPGSMPTPNIAIILPPLAEKDIERTPVKSKHVATPRVLSNKRPSAVMPRSGKKSVDTPHLQLSAKTAAKRPGMLTPVPLCPLSNTNLNNLASKSAVKGTPALRLSSTKLKQNVTPKSAVKGTPASRPSSTKVKRGDTPNFQKLHQKEFDKMESIDEYQKRKALNSAKKLKEHLKFSDPSKSEVSKKVALKKANNMPKTFGGIPFIPSVTCTKDMKTNFTLSEVRPNFASMPNKKTTTAKYNGTSFLKKGVNDGDSKWINSVHGENTPLKSKSRFDLRASLAKKLPYKPHVGPLKPLNETILNNTIACPPLKKSATKQGVKAIKTESKLVQAKRVQSREILRGVRTNRRFELQMQKRKRLSA